jgi:hypothetical protein
MPKSQMDDFDAVRAVIEALTGFEATDQERILRWAREKLGLVVQPLRAPAPPPQAPPTDPSAHHPVIPGGTESNTDIKSFVSSKAPTSDSQFVAVVAYYYRFQAPAEARKEAITSDDVLEACRLTGRSRPSKIAQTMVNAHNQGLIDRAEPRGSYAINTVGENLVALTLPAGSGGNALKAPARRSARKPVVNKPAAKKPSPNRKPKRR